MTTVSANALSDLVRENLPVAIIADLKILDVPDETKLVSCLGHTAAGDGGHEDWFWDADSTDADDSANGIGEVTTVIPNGHSGAGRWKRLRPSFEAQQVRSVATIAALLAQTGMVDGQHAEVTSYYAAATPDGGGGKFQYSASSTATHNGGTVIKPTAVSGAGRWLAVDNKTSSFAKFGAVNDGITDSTTLMQAALDAVLNIEEEIEGSYKITSSLLYRTNQSIKGISKGGLVGKTKITVTGAVAVFKSVTATTAAVFHPTFENLTVNNADTSKPAGSIGIDLLDVSFAVIKNCSYRNNEKNVRFGGTLAGQYNTLYDNEVSSSTKGLSFETAANANRVFGGRIHSCTTGIHASSGSGNTIYTTVENCETGVDLLSGCNGWNIGGYFEGNGDTIAGSVQLQTLEGAAVLLRSGTFNNHVSGYFSSGVDRVIDQGQNFVHAKSTGYSGTAPYAGPNLFLNAGLRLDTNADGIADGLALSAALPAGMTLSLDTTAGNFVTGANSQLWTIAAAGSSNRRLQTAAFPTVIGVQYAIAVRAKTNLASGFNVRCGTTTSASEFFNLPLTLVGEWAIASATFTATTTTTFIHFFMPTSTTAGGLAEDAKLWVDSIYFGSGGKAPEFGHTPPMGSALYNPGSLVDGAGETTTVTATGALLGDSAIASFSLDLQGVSLNAWVSSAGTISIRFQNETGGTVDLAVGDLVGRVIR